MSMTDKEFLAKYIFDILQVSEWENLKSGLTLFSQLNVPGKGFRHLKKFCFVDKS